MNPYARTTVVLALLLGPCNMPAPANDFQSVAIIGDARIDEASGMAASYTHPGALWIHNDSGDTPRLFLVDRDGETMAVVNVDHAEAVDWEDMCSFRLAEESWLLVADFGDNQERRGTGRNPPCVLYLLREPKIPPSNGQPTVRWNVSATVQFSYDDGAHNCEGIAVDVARREVLILTKTKPDICGLYVLPLDVGTAQQVHIAKRIASPLLPFVTGIDVDSSGLTMAICSMADGVTVSRRPQESWADAINRNGRPLPLPPRRQGETICFRMDGRAIYVHSEHASQPLWRCPWPPAKN